jgi:hypothetical protein
MQRILLAPLVGAVCLATSASYAADIVDEWSSIKHRLHLR